MTLISSLVVATLAYIGLYQSIPEIDIFLKGMIDYANGGRVLSDILIVLGILYSSSCITAKCVEITELILWGLSCFC